LVFLASAAVLVAEIAAPRLLARSVGTSIHAWAASIATFLGGLALGNAWGGRLADLRGARVLPLLAGLSALTLLVASSVHAALEPLLADSALAPGWRALLLTPLCFVVPAVLLGTLPPLAAHAGLSRGIAPGLVLGRLSAAGSLGAALGVFGAGYLLVPGLATPTVLVAAALLVGLPGLLLLRFVRRPASARRDASAPPPPDSMPPAAPTPASGSDLSPRALLWLSAFSGAVFLALELAAGRIAVLGLGNSIYTWTAVLGVMLTGAALGAWLGGRYAERHPPRRALAGLFVWAVLGVGICVWTPLVMPRLLLPALPWAAQSLLAVAVGFLPAAVALGALGPALARAALSDPARHGRSVGAMQAAGTLGAVLGALLCPFALLPLLGTTTLILMLTFWLAWTADWLTHTRALLPLRGVLTLLAVLAVTPATDTGGLQDTLAGFGRVFRLREDAPQVHVRESAYYRIRVEPEPTRWCLLASPVDPAALDADPLLKRQARFAPARSRLYWTGAPMTSEQYAALVKHLSDERDGAALGALAKRTHHVVRQMGLDKLTHGFADLSDPTWVGYDYELVAAAVWRQVAPATGQRAFFVGGGPYTFQRRLLALDPEAQLTTAEIDPEVTRAARDWLGLGQDARHRVLHQDARLALPALEESERFHVVFGDAFNDFSVPFHLTTQEFAREVRGRLLPGGVYLVNVVDAFQHGAFLSAMRRTLASVFAHVEVLSLAPREDEQRDTFLLVASDAPVPLDALLDDFERPLPVVRYPAADLDALQARTEAPLLTDAYAPVEALLAPLARSPER
jgi:spermidine synthase